MRRRETPTSGPTSKDPPTGRRVERPASALRAVRARRSRTREELAREGQARDRLHAAIDALNGRVPSRLVTLDLLAVAEQAFSESSAAGRLVRVLKRYVEVEHEDDDEPEYKGGAVM